MEKFDLSENQNKIVNMLLDDCICENVKIFTVYLHKFCLSNIKDCDNPTKEEMERMTHVMLVLADLFNVSQDIIDEEYMIKIKDCMEGCEEGIKELRDLYR